MPEYVHNKVHLSGRDVGSLVSFVRSGYEDFDFNAVIPMPKELDLPIGRIEDESIRVAQWYNTGKSPTFDVISLCKANGKSYINMATLGNMYLSNERKYGFSTWYYWRKAKWGTKWNAQEVKWVSRREVNFYTADQMPIGVYLMLTAMFPELMLEVTYRSDTDNTKCGHVIFQKCMMYD